MPSRRAGRPRARAPERSRAEHDRRDGDPAPHHRPPRQQRLQIEDWYRRHPEIDDEPIDAPLIGLGLPRTGSTALSCLLGEDPRRPFAAPVGVGRTVSAAVHRRGTRPAAHAHGGRGRAPAADHAAHAGARPHFGELALRVPGPHGARLQVAPLPGVRVRPVVLRVAARRRPHVDLSLRAPHAQAAAVGRARPGRGD